MIPVYNCAKYLKECIESVLQQDQGIERMQIHVVDDASTDIDVKLLVDHLGKGRIEYFRQPQNVGSLRNFETCLNLSRGNFVHLLHADDKVKIGYYAAMDRLFAKFPEAGAAFCRYSYIDERGVFQYHRDAESTNDTILQNWLVRIAERQRIQYAAISVKREVYEHLGSFYGLSYGEDWVMWARIAKEYPVAYTPEVLAEYRMHNSSISSEKFLEGANTKDMITVMQQMQLLLPPSERKGVLKRSKKIYAHYGLFAANQVWHHSHNRKSALRQIKEAAKLHIDPLLIWKITKLSAKMIMDIA